MVMLALEFCARWRHAQKQKLIIGVRVIRYLPFLILSRRKFGFKSFDLVPELVVHKFIEKRLGDDLKFIPVITQSIIGADVLQAINQLLDLRREIHCVKRHHCSIP